MNDKVLRIDGANGFRGDAAWATPQLLLSTPVAVPAAIAESLS